MGCGQSNEEVDNSKKEQQESKAESVRSERKAKDTSTNKGELSASSPQAANSSMSPGSAALSSSHLNGSLSSLTAPGVIMPTHTIIDSSGHKVTSCISSRSKLDSVTRWVDHITRHKGDHGGWRNPQDDIYKEKTNAAAMNAATASQAGSVTSERSAFQPSPGLGDGSTTASTSQLSLNVPTTPVPGQSQREVGSNMPVGGSLAADLNDLASPGPGSPLGASDIPEHPAAPLPSPPTGNVAPPNPDVKTAEPATPRPNEQGEDGKDITIPANADTTAAVPEQANA